MPTTLGEVLVADQLAADPTGTVGAELYVRSRAGVVVALQLKDDVGVGRRLTQQLASDAENADQTSSGVAALTWSPATSVRRR